MGTPRCAHRDRHHRRDCDNPASEGIYCHYHALLIEQGGEEGREGTEREQPEEQERPDWVSIEGEKRLRDLDILLGRGPEPNPVPGLEEIRRSSADW